MAILIMMSLWLTHEYSVSMSAHSLAVYSSGQIPTIRHDSIETHNHTTNSYDSLTLRASEALFYYSPLKSSPSWQVSIPIYMYTV